MQDLLQLLFCRRVQNQSDLSDMQQLPLGCKEAFAIEAAWEDAQDTWFESHSHRYMNRDDVGCTNIYRKTRTT